MVIAVLAVKLLKCGLPVSDLGVASPYRAQLVVIRDQLRLMLRAEGWSNAREVSESVEIETIDKYQGRDKPCLLVSTVHSNAVGEVIRGDPCSCIQ